MRENKNASAKQLYRKPGKIRLGCSFFFVRPGSNSNVRLVAQRLASIRHVREVHITEGEYGFVVKSSLLDYEKQQELGRRIEKTANGTSKALISHCEISK